LAELGQFENQIHEELPVSDLGWIGGVELASGGRSRHAAIYHGAHHLLSTFRGQAGILVAIHQRVDRRTGKAGSSKPIQSCHYQYVTITDAGC
jgi:hypothetical protein